MIRTFVVNPGNVKWMEVLAFLQRTIRDAVRLGETVVVNLTEPKRNSESNACMWAMLHDLEQQVVWKPARWKGDRMVEAGCYVLRDGERDMPGIYKRLSDEDFKDVLSAAMRKRKFAGSVDTDGELDGGVVAIGMRTSKMTQRQMGDLIELIGVFGSKLGVQWTEPKKKAAA
jgi:NinB protein.